MGQKFIFKGFHPCADGEDVLVLEGKSIRGRFVQGGGILSGDEGRTAYIPVSRQDAKIVVTTTETMAFIEVLEVIPETVFELNE